MKIRSLLYSVVGLVLLAACAAPAATKPKPTETKAEAPSSSTTAAPQAAATSRGDALYASDPASVQIGAGKPVFIEFFRFT